MTRTVTIVASGVVILALAAGPSAAETPAARARPDGASELAIAVTGSLQNPAFSPDGATLLLTSFSNGYNEGPASLYTHVIASQDTSLLTSAPDSDNVNLPGSSWNPLVDRITFSSDREDIDEVWTIDADGSDPFRVTNHVTSEYYIEPSFSPDGTWIVFEAAPMAADQGSLWKVRANGTDLSQLTDGPGGGTDDRQPNWSPVADRIVFQRRAAGSDDWNLYTIASDGSGLVQVTTSPAGDTDASWSADGERILYSSDYGELAYASLFVIPAAGGTPWRATSDNTSYDGAPSWSPDGAWIAFESCVGDPDESAGTTLWTIAADVVPGFWDGFESADLRVWSASVGGVAR
jgi:TolB protein